MKFINKLSHFIHSKSGAFLSFILGVCAYVFVSSADWTYSWISASYPLGEKFIPTFLGIIAASSAINFIYLIYAMFNDKGRKIKVLNIFHTLFWIIGIITFIYACVLLFGIDSGITAAKFTNGLSAISGKLVYVAILAGIGLVLTFTSEKKQRVKSIIACVIVGALITSMSVFSNGTSSASESDTFINPDFGSENLVANAEISFESLAQNEKCDAKNLLTDSNKYWTAQCPNKTPADGYDNVNNAICEIKLGKKESFNTAVIEELGNQAQYFRIQAKVNDEWITVYQSEKIQSMRLCSFDTVTADTVRLSIDKFRDNSVPVKIKSFKLYNVEKRDAKDFEVTAYQRLDGDVPTEILKKGDEYVKNYAKYYDVYSTIIVFGATNWNENGDLTFGESGEEGFAKELKALKKIISMRCNKDHKVKLIVTTLADGAFGDSVNTYMAKYWDKIEKQTVDFADKYGIDGVDIDWEYPQSSDDWAVYDKFIQKLSNDLKKIDDNMIVSTALSSGALGLSKETYNSIDQIQFMAYDGCDEDGYQSSLEQAQQGLRDFQNNGADISKINIGIAAYGRPINSTPFWATWRDLPDANYWNNKYFTVNDSNQIYEGTFCSPALAGDKLAYSLLSGAGGVMVFRVGCDKTMDNPNAVANGLKNTLDRLTNNQQ